MASTLYGLSALQVERLKKLLDMVERGELSGPTAPRTRRDLYADRCIVGILDGAAAAVSGLTGTPTVATLSVYGFSSAGSTDTTRNETVYNFAPQAATTDRWTVCQRDNVTGKWVIHTQFCTT